MRGIAIVLIMLTHIAYMNIGSHDWKYELWNNSVFTLFFSSSLIFIFISGYLLCFIDSNRCFEKGWIKRFYVRKIKNLICPYMVISLFIGCVSNTIGTKDFWYKLVCFSVQPPYWYIGFIVICFIFAPFLLRLNKKYFYVLATTLLFFPLFTTRTIFGLYPLDVFLHSLKTFFYFVPMFMLGMLCFYFKEKIDGWVKQNLIQIVLLFLLSTCSILLYIYVDDYDWRKWWRYGLSSPFSWITTLIYVKTICLIFILKVLLQYLVNKGTNLKILDVLSRYSFGLYFLHCFINEHFGIYLRNSLLSVTSNRPLVMFIVISSVIVLTLVICILLKKVFGKHARMICGC